MQSFVHRAEIGDLHETLTLLPGEIALLQAIIGSFATAGLLTVHLHCGRLKVRPQGRAGSLKTE